MCMSICESVFIYVCMSVGVCIYTFGCILVYLPLTYPFSCFFFSFTFFSYFCSDLRDHNEKRRFYSFCAIPAIVDAIHICL